MLIKKHVKEKKSEMNEIIESLYRRKSVRVYEDRAIPEEMKDMILEAAMQAPTAGCQIGRASCRERV